MTTAFTFTSKITDFHKFYERLGKSVYKKVQTANEAAARKSVQLLRQKTVEFGAFATGRQLTPFIEGWEVRVLGRTVSIVNTAAHAWYVLHGSRHWPDGGGKLPPYARIREWVEWKFAASLGTYREVNGRVRKMAVDMNVDKAINELTWKVMRAIVRRGIPARPIALRVDRAIQQLHEDELRKRLEAAYREAAS